MRILMSAYACEPGKGSEPGAGWNLARAAAIQHDVCVITRSNNRGPIEAALAADPQPSLRFVYVDLPSWARRWKRHRRSIRVYYTIWQVLAGHEARRLCRLEQFDVVHHVTFANAWLPALACVAGPPFVLGPVAGGQSVPLALYPSLGLKGVLTELLLSLRFLGRINPVVRIGWRRARVILVNNAETTRRLPRAYRAKCTIRPNACVDGLPDVAVMPRVRPHAMFVGRLHRFKGVEIAVRAIALAPDWNLTIVGSGPDQKRLRRIVKGCGLEDRVSFVDPLPQYELWQLLGSCDALMLPSLKEGASFVAAEAQALGVPVVAFDTNGPAALASMSGSRFELVAPKRVRGATKDFAEALERLRTSALHEPWADYGLAALGRDLDRVYGSAISPTGIVREAAA